MRSLCMSLTATAVILASVAGCNMVPLPRTSRIPAPDTVSNEVIPQPFTDNMYFLYGEEHTTAVHSLKQLEENGFDVEDAWYPDWSKEGPCSGIVIPQQMILRLEAPNPRIYDFNYVSRSNGVRVYCIPVWLHYDFD